MVKRVPYDENVMGLNIARCRTFSSLYFIGPSAAFEITVSLQVQVLFKAGPIQFLK